MDTDKKNIFRKWVLHPIWHTSLRTLLHWAEVGGQGSDVRRLQALVDNKIAYANQMRVELNRLRGELAAAQRKLLLVAEIRKTIQRLENERRDLLVSEINRLRQVFVAARELDSFLHRNTGETADWPVSITVRGGAKDDVETANELCRLMQALTDSLKAK